MNPLVRLDTDDCAESREINRGGGPCPKCNAMSGDDWSQGRGVCPMQGSPHGPKRKTENEKRKTAGENPAQLFLPAPYGYNTGDSIQLTCTRPVDLESLADVLSGYGCYPPSVPRICRCIYFSGRYDCSVQPYWFRRQREALCADLSLIGIRMVVTNTHIKNEKR